MSAFKYFTSIEVAHEALMGGGLLSDYSVEDPERRRLKLKHAWHWFVLLPTTGRSLTGGTNLIGTVVDCVASGSGP